MLRATLKSLLARKLRLLLASLAVLLGVAFVSGTFVLSDTMNRVFDDLFKTINQGISVTVQTESEVDDEFGGLADEPVPASILDTVKKVPGVRAARGEIFSLATLILPNGKAVTGFGPPTFGFAFDPSSPLENYELKEGRAPVGIGQVAINKQSADKHHLKIGDKISVGGRGPKQPATITGFIGLKGTGQEAGATNLAFDTPSAARLFGIPGRYAQITVAADEGVTDQQLRDRIAKALPAKGYSVQTSAQAAESQADDVQQNLSFFTTLLKTFGFISVFVGAFLIFNTFSMLVAQRTRELALLRALGASRKQIRRSLVLEALIVGLLSSLGGFGVGVLVAVGIRGLFGAAGVELPRGPLVVAPSTLIVCLAVGMGFTLLAALVPAWRASRIAPVRAMRESGPAEDRSLVRRTAIGAGILALGVAALISGLASGELRSVGAGAALSFIGVTVLSPLFSRGVIHVLAAPLARLGLSSSLGRSNAMRSPRRTSATAAALMIGLGLVATISTVGASAKQSTVDTVAKSFGADFVVQTSSFDSLPPQLEKDLAVTPEVDAVAGFRYTKAIVGNDRDAGIQGVAATALQKVMRLDVLSGSIADLATDTVAISRKTADKLKVAVGESVPVTWVQGKGPDLKVIAIYDTNQFAGGYLVTNETYLAHNTDRGPFVVAVKGSSSLSASRKALESALVGYPQVKVQDQQEFVKSQGDQIDTFLNVITLMLVFSVFIALLGVVNTLALSVIERTRELGLLRAVGLQRKQVRRMIRVESVIIAVYGALLGSVVGLGFGYAITYSLKDEGITSFALPFGRLVGVVALTAVGGVLAAALPARRAARMDVLEAIATT